MRRPDRYPPVLAAADVLAPYLRTQAADFLRGLRLHRENSAPTDAGGRAAEEAADALRRAARRISGTLHTFRDALDPAWAEELRTELAWLSGTMAREHAYAARLTRLLDALHQLSDSAKEQTVGTARAGALLERQLTLARTRAHSAALQALGSSRFHAVADAVALLASDVPLCPTAEPLHVSADHAEQRLLTAVAALPRETPDPYDETQDALWHRTRLLLRLHRYAHEVVRGTPEPALRKAGRALDAHRDAAEAAAASASAARTPRIAPATAYTLGVLHADQRHEVRTARTAFREAWPYVSAP
ncbi:CHAD domain-containing protein [Streptomyces sp. DT171]|uniref:CHAD domain-containing protein n=1 Tax=Streptomyces sp. DT171 TaxID=3416524 RepID=UPI003CE751DA